MKSRFLFLAALANSELPWNGATGPAAGAVVSAFSPTKVTIPIIRAMATIEAPTRETTETDRRTSRRSDNDSSAPDTRDLRKDGPLEYLEDPNESREMDDPFHILLLGETFDKPKITLNYCSGNLQYTLDMPYEDAIDASMVAQDFGMACLGTWSREECLDLGRQLRVRDLVVRVVPYAAGGNRSWQSKEGSGSWAGEGLKDAGGAFLQ